jgi:ribokinase
MMARVVVLGSSNTDLTVRLPRLPAPGQTVLGGAFATGPGGKGANQAVAARRAGADVVFVTAVGDDPLGRQALELYRREGIDVAHARVIPGVASGVALIFVAEDGENMIGVAPGANARLVPDDVDRLPDSLFDPDAILLAGLEVPLETVGRAIERASAAGMTIILNPAPAPAARADWPWLARVDVLTPNRAEARALSGQPAEPEEEMVRVASALRGLGARHVVVTLGSEGCLVASDRAMHTIPAHRVSVVDTVGAGDAFNGALAVALAERRDLVEAAAWASAAAALAVTQAGAQAALPRRDAIDRLAASAGT